MGDWFARAVVHVRDVDASLRFYVEHLGFASPWRYEDAGRAFVAQVERDECALILSSTWAEKAGAGTVFVSINSDDGAAGGAAALDALRREFESRGAAVKEGWWGYRLLVVEDPDGNQLLFNYPNGKGEGAE